MTHLALLRSANKLRLGYVASPPLETGDVRVRLLSAAVCGTDLDILRGARNDRAQILGHEGVAEVIERGPRVSGFALGERVVFNPVNAANQDDILGHSKDGIFQELRLIRESELRADMIVPLGDGLDPSSAVLAEPLAAVCYAVELCAHPVPRHVTIVGGGSIAVLLAWLLRRSGAHDITIRSRTQASYASAVARGILDEAYVSFAPDETAASASADVCFVCARRDSSAAALRDAVAALRDQGVVCLVSGVVASGRTQARVEAARRANVCGTNHAPWPPTMLQSGGKRFRMIGHRGTSLAHVQRALALLRTNPVLQALCVATVPFAELPGLLTQLVADGPRSPLKTRVLFPT
jgi:threonine dehydrogenase-like Zn-dependent dehydrogenase